MPDLGGWDGAILISGRALSDLVVALDQSVRPTVESSEAETRSGLSVNCVEQFLNLELFVPRLLYATMNATWSPDLADAEDELERLHARLKEYGRLTEVEVTSLNPPTFTVLGDPGARLTFLRDQWYDGVEVTPTLELQPLDFPANTVRLSFGGRVFIGDNFVDGATAAGAPLTFRMSLAYRVQVRSGNFFPLDLVSQLDDFKSLPFTTLGADCFGVVGRHLPPQAGYPVWAQNTGVVREDGTAVWRLTGQSAINGGRATLFTGGPGDIIWDSDDNPRWVVLDVPREANDDADELKSLPRRVLVEVTCPGPDGQPTVVAESGKGHGALIFDEQNFSVQIFEANGQERVLAPGHRDAIRRSIMKLDGFLVGAMLNPLFQQASGVPPPSPQFLALLALLGQHGMDIAPLPAELALPLEPRLVEDEDGSYVLSDVILFEDAATRVFAPVGPGGSGAIAFGGRFRDRPAPAGPLPENFGRGQDLAIGLSQTVVNRWLLPQIRRQLRDTLNDDVPGFDQDAFDDCGGCLTLTLANNRIDVHVAGEGEQDTGLFDVPFSFTMDFPLRLQTRPAVARLNNSDTDLDGTPVDVLGFPLPEDLSCLGLDPLGGDLISTAVGGANPLCFRGYLDPRVPGVDLTTQPAGFWIRVSGDGCPTCAIPSALCPDGPLVGPAFRWRERDFAVPPFPANPFAVTGLHPALEVAFVPPARSEVQLEIDFPWWADLAVGFLAGPALGLIPPHAILLTGALADLIVFRAMFEEFRAGVAGETPLQPNFTLGWQFFLQNSDPTNPADDALTIDSHGLFMLFRVLAAPSTSLGSWAPTVCEKLGFCGGDTPCGG